MQISPLHRARPNQIQIGLLAMVLTGFSLALSPLQAQPSANAQQKFWTPNGNVNAIVMTDDTLYLGGDFSYIGPRTGPAITFAQATGQWQAAPPQIKGTLKAVVPDGAGGWFIGGQFSAIGNTFITNVAHLHSDLSLDTDWNARITGTTINALALDAGRLYIGGSITRIAGVTIAALAGLDAGSAVVNWTPGMSGTVNALQVGGGIVYAGGQFSSVGTSTRQNIAAISIATALATAWNAGVVDGNVLALSLGETNLYVGGQFNNIGSQPRARITALDLVSGLANNWNPNPNGFVRAIVATPTNVYVGGDFTVIALVSRRGFASLSATAPATTQPLDLQLQSASLSSLVRTIVLDGNSLYVGGAFTDSISGAGPMLVGWDVSSDTEIPIPLATTYNGTAGAVFAANAGATANGTMFVGGDFFSFGGVARQRAAALSLSTGAALPWAPTFNASVLTMAHGSNGIYVGGSFTNVNGDSSIRGLALVDAVTGDLAPFTFRGTNGTTLVTVKSLILNSDALYVGGAFTVVSNLSRRFVAALNPVTGAPIPTFDAKLGGGSLGVTDMALAGTNLYLAGDFTTVNAISDTRLAAVSPETGASQGWMPAPNQPVNALSATSDTLYVGGNFTTISGLPIKNFAAYNVANNSLLLIDAALPVASSGITALNATPTVFYAAGTFTAIGGQNRKNLAALTNNVVPYDWNPSPDVAPSVIAVTDQQIAIGGSFRVVGNQDNAFLAVFSRAPETTISLAGSSVQIHTTTGDRTDAVLQSTPSLSNPVWSDLATYPPGNPQTQVIAPTSPQQFFRVIAR